MRGVAKYIWFFIFLAFVGGFLLADMAGLVGMSPVTASTVVAKVNGQEIPYLTWDGLTRSLTQQQEQQTGRSLNHDERRAVENQAFEQLVSDVLLQQEYEKRGIRVTDQEIIQAARFSPPPQFYSWEELQTDGRFDPAKYERYLASPIARQQGLLAQLESYYRTEIPRNRLFSQLASDVWVSDEQLFTDFKDQADTVSVSFVALRPTPEQVDAAVVTDAEARKYYDAYDGRWEAAGRGTISVVSLSRIPTAADTASLVERLRALREEIVSGNSTFAAVAQRESEDTISGPDGGDLGRGPRGRFVPEFEEEAFKLRAGQISQPVRTSFGWHLIHATERRGDTLALSHILLTVRQNDSSATATDRAADRLASYAAGSDEPWRLDSIANEMGLVVTQIPIFDGQTASYLNRGVGGLTGWAFSGARVGDISDLLDDENGYYVVRLDSIRRGGAQSFAAVKDDIILALKERKSVEELLAQGESILAEARNSSLEAAAASAGLTVEESGPFTRLGFVPGIGFYNEAVGAAFGAPVGTVALAKIDNAVIVLRPDSRKEVTREEFEAQADMQRQRAMQALREQRLQGFLQNLRTNAKVDDRRDNINARIRRQTIVE